MVVIVVCQFASVGYRKILKSIQYIKNKDYPSVRYRDEYGKETEGKCRKYIINTNFPCPYAEARCIRVELFIEQKNHNKRSINAKKKEHNRKNKDITTLFNK